MAEIIMTNRIFINTMLDPAEVTKIMRVFTWYLEAHADRYATLEEKSRLYEEWLDLPFNQDLWERACTPYAKGTIPKDFAMSIKWAYNIYAREAKNIEKKTPRHYVRSDHDPELCGLHSREVARSEKELRVKPAIKIV